MTVADHVKAVHILADDNPWPRVATFRFTPACGEAAIMTRIRLARSQEVVAVAELSDGLSHWTRRRVAVVIGGCGA